MQRPLCSAHLQVEARQTRQAINCQGRSGENQRLPAQSCSDQPAQLAAQTLGGETNTGSVQPWSIRQRKVRRPAKSRSPPNGKHSPKGTTEQHRTCRTNYFSAETCWPAFRSDGICIPISHKALTLAPYWQSRPQNGASKSSAIINDIEDKQGNAWVRGSKTTFPRPFWGFRANKKHNQTHNLEALIGGVMVGTWAPFGCPDHRSPNPGPARTSRQNPTPQQPDPPRGILGCIGIIRAGGKGGTPTPTHA